MFVLQAQKHCLLLYATFCFPPTFLINQLTVTERFVYLLQQKQNVTAIGSEQW